MSNIICGTSKVKITPSAELLPRLYGLMRSHYAGVIDDIHVRVMMLGNSDSRAMFVSWELDKAPNPEELVPALSVRTGIPEENILFFAVHTHTAPLHSARPGDGPNGRAKQTPEVQEATFEFEAVLKEALFKAADEAMENAVPVKLGFGRGKSFIGENRVADYYIEQEDGSVRAQAGVGSNPEGYVDNTLFVMRADDMEGRPVAFLVNYAVHACVMILNNFDGNGGVGISADVAGAASSLLEEKFPGCVALWSSGAAGNVNPVMMNQYNYADPLTGKAMDCRDYSSAEPAKLMLLLMGHRHFADILKTNREISCDIENTNIVSDCEIAHMDIPHGDETRPYDVRLKSVRIGDAVLCGVSGELFNTLGRAVREESSFENTVIINHECSFLYNSGYIFDDDALRRCMTAEGKLDGLPGIFKTPLKPGFIEPALRNAAAALFSRLK